MIDLGTVRVPKGRWMAVALEEAHDRHTITSEWADVTASVEGATALRPYGRGWGDSWSFLLPSPPPPSARLVVRMKGIDTPLASVAPPFDFGPGRPLRVKVPLPPRPK